MSFQWLRRALLTAACVSPLLLAACGGGSVESEFQPSRVVVFGDAFADAGQRGVRYTVNNGGINWTEQVAARYGLTVAPSPGGTSYATGSARVSAMPDAAGNALTPTINQQITNFLARGLGSGDLVVVAGGTADIIAEVEQLRLGNQTAAQARANVEQAAVALGAEIQRLVSAGAQHVLVAGPYNLGRSPWNANTIGGRSTCDAPQDSPSDASPACLSSAFNQRLLIAIVNLGEHVLYADAALYFNLVTSNPGTYGFTDVSSVLCTSVGSAIGIGPAPQVDSTLCSGGTLSGAPLATSLFADPVYFTPAGHTAFGNHVFDRLRERW